MDVVGLSLCARLCEEQAQIHDVPPEAGEGVNVSDLQFGNDVGDVGLVERGGSADGKGGVMRARGEVDSFVAVVDLVDDSGGDVGEEHGVIWSPRWEDELVMRRSSLCRAV